MTTYPIEGDIASGKNSLIDPYPSISDRKCAQIIRCGINKAADWGAWAWRTAIGVIQQDVAGQG